MNSAVLRRKSIYENNLYLPPRDSPMALMQPRLQALDGRTGATHNGHAWDKVGDAPYWNSNQRPRPVEEGIYQLE